MNNPHGALEPIRTMPQRRTLPALAILCILFAGGWAATAWAAHTNQAARPVTTIPVGPLGYRPLGSLYMLLRLSSSSLDFVDDSHLLFTFHYSRLLSREAEQGHDDQSIHAVVLDVRSGKAGATADWRMHDRRQYLYALGEGSFLVRQGDELQRTRADLVLHPYIRFQHRLERVQISPDGQMLTVQSDLERHVEEKHRQLVAEAIANGENLPDEDVDIQMVLLKDRRVVAEAKSENPLKLAVTTSGYVKHEQLSESRREHIPPDQWKIHFHPFYGTEKTLSTVTSTCTPSEDFLSAEVLMLNLCSSRSADRYVSAVNLEGKELWKGEWDARFVEPNLGLSSGGRNFAISWIVANHPVDASFSLSDGDVQGQAVQVLSTATGHLLLSVNASPVSSAGQNFALSADGSRLAVLNKGAIEVYEVPADTAK